MQLTPNREIGFGFVSCSCRACERAGEAKLCVRVRERAVFGNAGSTSHGGLGLIVQVLIWLQVSPPRPCAGSWLLLMRSS